jgi:hypothetical protein
MTTETTSGPWDHVATPTDTSSYAYRSAARALLVESTPTVIRTFPEEAAERLSKHHKFADLLGAYARQRTAGLPTTENARHIIRRIAGTHVTPEEFILGLVNICEDFPADAAQITTEIVFLIDALPLYLASTDILGLLRADVFATLTYQHVLLRSDYLLARLSHARPALTSDQLDVARTLTEEWAGTLDSLCDTARHLCPKTTISSADVRHADGGTVSQ